MVIEFRLDLFCYDKDELLSGIDRERFVMLLRPFERLNNVLVRFAHCCVVGVDFAPADYIQSLVRLSRCKIRGQQTLYEAWKLQQPCRATVVNTKSANNHSKFNSFQDLLRVDDLRLNADLCQATRWL